MSAVTYKDVEEAIVSLLLEGKNPTIDNIRIYLGTDDEKRGSPNTITKFRNEWRAKVAANRSIMLPAPIPQEALSAIAGLWGALKSEAAKDFSIQRASMEETVREADQARAASENEALALRERIDDQVRDIQILQMQCAQKDARSADLLDEVNSLKAALERTRESLFSQEKSYQQSLEAHRKEADDRLAEVSARHKVELEKREDQVAVMKSKVAELQEQIRFERSRDDAERDRLMMQIDDARQAAAEEKRRAQLQSEQSASQLSDLRRASASELSEAKAKQELLLSNIEQLERQIDTHISLLAEKEREVSTLKNLVDELKKRKGRKSGKLPGESH